jgi:hypothetical protein
MALKIFVATRDGDCAICHKNVKGSRALFNLKKQLVHADCQFPQKAGQKKPEQSKPPKPKEEVNLEQQKEDDLWITQNLEIAGEWVRSYLASNPDMEKTAAGLLTEIARERHALLMSHNMQRNKQANIKAVNG